MASYVLGNVLTAFVITSVNLVQFYTIMTSICFASSCFFLFLKVPLNYPDPSGGNSEDDNGSLLTVPSRAGSLSCDPSSKYI